MTHRGIRLRISIPAGVLLEADSDELHYTAQMAGASQQPQCGPACLPGCQEHVSWLNVLAGLADTTGLVLEIRPVELPDEYPDDDDGQADDDELEPGETDYCSCASH